MRFSAFLVFRLLLAACCGALCGGAASPAAAADALPGTELLTLDGDIAERLVAGADRFLLDETAHSEAKRSRHWKRDAASADAYQRSVAPNRARLAHLLGVRDPRVAFDELELVGGTARPALVAKGAHYDVFVVRWPAFADVHGEGLLLVPDVAKPVADVIAIPDCAQTPEQAVGLSPGVAPAAQYARRLAESGCRVLVPMLINRDKRSEKVDITNREWIYRGAYEMGRGMIGYELEKVLAAVDYFAKSATPAPIGVVGWSEGGLLALYAGALDPRISAVCVSGYFDRRDQLWQEPLDRNLFGLLDEFGDAELASLVAPRPLVVEAAGSAELTLAGGRGGPGRIVTPKLADVQAEAKRAAELTTGLPNATALKLVPSGADGAGPCGTPAALSALLAALGAGGDALSAAAEPARVVGRLVDPAARHARQFHELDRHTQALLAESKYVRDEFFWSKVNYDSLDKYAASTAPLRKYFAEEVIGRFDLEPLPPHARTRMVEKNAKWTRYEVVLDLFPEVIVYGLLTLPAGTGPAERRPVVVCQHGLEGRPADVIGQQQFAVYHGFATELAEQGFITFAPQNLYIFQDKFRTLQRKANPLKKTLFSLISAQHRQLLAWLGSLPQVDAQRIGFYGLSYGGKTAMRVPALVEEYALSICSADFNEWIDKNVSSRGPYSYMNTGEYEIFEFDLGNTFNYAEMAALIAPRPFMVERGHFDGVGTDENVAHEYAKARRVYALLKIPERTEIEWFLGPHSINAQGTYAFLSRQLHWPEKP